MLQRAAQEPAEVMFPEKLFEETALPLRRVTSTYQGAATQRRRAKIMREIADAMAQEPERRNEEHQRHQALRENGEPEQHAGARVRGSSGRAAPSKIVSIAAANAADIGRSVMATWL